VPPRGKPPVNVVPKSWGREVWIVNNETYCGKILYITAGKTGSLHFHQHKTETFYLRVGRPSAALQPRQFAVRSALRVVG
jgi:mannose-6-phosphate isomerase-like protein (cupin superfamily)